MSRNKLRNVTYTLRRLSARYPDLFPVLTVSLTLVGLLVLANLYATGELPATPSYYTEGVHCERIQFYYRRVLSASDKLVVFDQLYRVERPLVYTQPWVRELVYRGPGAVPPSFNWSFQYNQMLVNYMQAHLGACERYSLEFFPRITQGIDYRLYDFVVGARWSDSVHFSHGRLTAEHHGSRGFRFMTAIPLELPPAGKYGATGPSICGPFIAGPVDPLYLTRPVFTEPWISSGLYYPRQFHFLYPAELFDGTLRLFRPGDYYHFSKFYTKLDLSALKFTSFPPGDLATRPRFYLQMAHLGTPPIKGHFSSAIIDFTPRCSIATEYWPYEQTQSLKVLTSTSAR